MGMFCLHVCLCMSVASKGQKRVLDPLELGREPTREALGVKPESWWKNSQCSEALGQLSSPHFLLCLIKHWRVLRYGRWYVIFMSNKLCGLVQGKEHRFRDTWT